MLSSKLKYISFLALLLFSGCKANFDNNIIINERNNDLNISANSILIIDKETSKLIIENNLSNDIVEIFKRRSNNEPDVSYKNDELTIKTPIIFSNGSLFGIHDITYKKNNNKNYEVSILHKEPIELTEAITNSNKDKYISQIFLENIKICNNLSVSGKIIMVSYDKDIWNLESKFSNNMVICTSASNLKESIIVISISIEESKTKYIIFTLILIIMLLLYYVYRKIIN